MNQTLLLASSSIYRKELLSRLKLPFSCASPNIDETRRPGEPPGRMVMRLSEEKALALAEDYPDALIIGSDQCATLDEEVIGKPLTHENAVNQLRKASGRSVLYRTGLCLLNTKTGTRQVNEVLYEVKFRSLTAVQIERYLKADAPYNCAGSIRSEALGISLFEFMRGDDPSALMGLPLIRLVDMLRQEGVDIP